jgi:hypothetical protein
VRIVGKGHRVQWVDEREVPHEARPWRPFVQTQPYAGGRLTELGERASFYANSHYLVHVYDTVDESGVLTGRTLSLRTVENDTRHDWREMQRVKNELAGDEWEGIELYPAESRVVDTANQYWLWCFPTPLQVGFPEGLRLDTDEAELRAFSTGSVSCSRTPSIRTRRPLKPKR